MTRVFLTSMVWVVVEAVATAPSGCRPRPGSAPNIVYPTGTVLFVHLDSPVCADTYKLGVRLKGYIEPTLGPEPPDYSLPDYSPVLLKLVSMLPEPRFVVLSVAVNGKILPVHASTGTNTDVEGRVLVARTVGVSPTVLCVANFGSQLLSPLVAPPPSHTPE